uniref:Uncharacterized protein n=1 Tax=Anguilla anguilla TaxID=7936 RepID=A0A0E9WDW4_ANGAN
MWFCLLAPSLSGNVSDEVLPLRSAISCKVYLIVRLDRSKKCCIVHKPWQWYCCGPCCGYQDTVTDFQLRVNPSFNLYHIFIHSFIYSYIKLI